MTPAQVTRGISMRHYAWGKRIRQIADEAGIDLSYIYKVIKAEPVSEAVRARLEGYLKTPAGPSALVQDHNRRWHGADGRVVVDCERFSLLRRIVRARHLAGVHGLTVCDRHRLKSLTNSELRVYFYNLGDRIKRHLMSLDQSISRHWKLPDEMEPWEFIERIDLLRAARSARDARRDSAGALLAQARPAQSAVVQFRRV
jgi:hypothetical protein